MLFSIQHKAKKASRFPICSWLEKVKNTKEKREKKGFLLNVPFEEESALFSIIIDTCY